MHINTCMKTPHDVPNHNWRKFFDFKPQFTSEPAKFTVDPLLIKYSTNAPIYNVWSSVPTKK